jgi:hypothetical protein
MPIFKLFNKEDEILLYIQVIQKRTPIHKAKREFIKKTGKTPDLCERLPTNIDKTKTNINIIIK